MQELHVVSEYNYCSGLYNFSTTVRYKTASIMLHSADRASRGESDGDCATSLQQLRSTKMFDIDNEGQCHRVDRSQCSHPMANINLYKSHT